MSLSGCEKEAVDNIWKQASGHAQSHGAEAFERVFQSYPQTKTYFSHYDLKHGSNDLKTQGANVFNAIGQAINHLDNLEATLSKLSDLHAFKLRVDPGNFELLNESILAVLAIHYPKLFTTAAHSGFDKLLCSISCVLTSKYR
ncbi:hemoglobin subunit alpha-3-like [Pelobates cultripes]|uniref:Hemoglobin subunit alpha-3-like n=1 Tax=Pelobates cultripes TaxID=61616 RepID=A0AAD1SRF3_PELCU|nr:hemoglobin subunit alpha-3-like [Pelobates cultripes]